MKKFLKDNYIELIILVVIGVMSLLPLPYYIDMPGGLISTYDRVKVDNETESEGEYYLTYVSEIQATPMLYLLALVRKDWDIFKESDMTLDNQTIEELYYFDTLLLKNGNGNTIINAYKYADLEYNIKNYDITVAYITPNANTTVVIGDVVKEVNGIPVATFSEAVDAISSNSVGDTISFKVQNGLNYYTREAKLTYLEDGTVGVGLSLISIKNVETNPKCELIYQGKESGPSGGLMNTLTLYDKLVEEDLTHGYKISGTGTMEEDGKVGSIGGVKYKLAGAVKKKADFFLVPAGENYEEAIKLQKEHNYKIKIVSIETFLDAINFLNNLD